MFLELFVEENFPFITHGYSFNGWYFIFFVYFMLYYILLTPGNHVKTIDDLAFPACCICYPDRKDVTCVVSR